MAKSLIIVESPTKVRTIQKFLGKKYVIKASVGHVRDLPKSKLSVDIKNNFTPVYEVMPDKKKVIDEIKKAATGAKEVYLAPDPDREGEAIANHIVEACGGFRGKKVHRVMFNEITAKGVEAGMSRPHEIDMGKVNAQQARRILDRLVGYKLSPLLWKKVRRGLSAGRVQSVALRLIVEREAKIAAFKPEEYWSVLATLLKGKRTRFLTKLEKVDGKKAKIGNKEEADAIIADIGEHEFKVVKKTARKRKRSPFPPFITSSLQQEAARRFRFNARKTMMLAQQLYEGIELGREGSVGLITYMRTDSFRVADEAVDFARFHIQKTFGDDYLPKTPHVYKSKKSAQEGHEAIRPAGLRLPEELSSVLTKDQLKLYTLIFQRFIASQMEPARIEGTRVDITVSGKREYLFVVRGDVVLFPGFLKLYDESSEKTKEAEEEEKEGQSDKLPPMNVGDTFTKEKIEGKQHFTQPPPRYTEASLIKELEEKGIGRPSTYASIMSVIRTRDYVESDKSRRFVATQLGITVSTMLSACFDDLLNPSFTAQLEEQLDKVELGEVEWVKLLQDFYKPFEADLKKADAQMELLRKELEKTDEVCEKCGKPMAKKWGKFGAFLACTGYPDCSNTRELGEEARDDAGEEEVDETCEKCGKPMVRKRGRRGEFLACSGYPSCKNTKNIDGTGGSSEPRFVEGETCPKCNERLQYRMGRFGEFIGCSAYPKCKYIKKEEKKTGVSCPEEGCGGELVEKRSRFGTSFYSCSNYPKCKFSVSHKPVSVPCPDCGAPFILERNTKRKGLFYTCFADGCDYEGTELP